MELKHPTTKIPHHESETSPHSQPLKLLTFTNGKTHHHHPAPHTPTVAYKECLKNHAVGIGGHAVDGCGEFMPAGLSSFKCAACGCHRNFHRRESMNHFPRHQTSPSTSQSPTSPPASAEPTNYALGQHLLLSLRTGTTADQSHTMATPVTPVGVKVSGRKRFRTKFSPEQKQKMLNFAEQVGWKMPRCDDKMLADFCNEIGIRRKVFKVWMHNNKSTLARREQEATTAVAIIGNTAVAASIVRSNDSPRQENASSSSSGNLSAKVSNDSFLMK